MDAEWQLVGVPVVERCKREILEDVSAGLVPATVASFSELHDYCDANHYGGAFEVDPECKPEITDELRSHQAFVDFWTRVQSEVDAWLKAGGVDRGISNH